MVAHGLVFYVSWPAFTLVVPQNPGPARQLLFVLWLCQSGMPVCDCAVSGVQAGLQETLQPLGCQAEELVTGNIHGIRGVCRLRQWCWQLCVVLDAHTCMLVFVCWGWLTLCLWYSRGMILSIFWDGPRLDGGAYGSVNRI